MPSAAPVPRRFASGDPGAVFRAALEALDAGRTPVLAVVVATEGSTYATTGTLALFDDDAQLGWISGGCLEPEIARTAMHAAGERALAWLDLDTTDDAAMLMGSATGCRGRQLLALVPLAALKGADEAMRTWLQGDRSLRVWLHVDGGIRCRLDGQAWSWTLPALSSPPEPRGHALVLHRPPEALLLGAGPETPVLVPLLRQLGWQLTVVERRPRWRAAVAPATRVLDLHPDDAIAARAQADVALVMHHGFEADREALEALAASRIPFIGLLGPQRRRDDLFKLLRPADRGALAERLHAPVGVPGCGRGPEAIALSIATQLQQWRGAQAALFNRPA